MSAVRAAGAEALDDLLRFLVVEFYCRHRNVLPELDVKKATAVIHRTLRDGHVFVVEDEHGDIVGSLGLLKTDAAWFAGEQVLSDPWFYVPPSYRKGTRAAMASSRARMSAGRGPASMDWTLLSTSATERGLAALRAALPG